MSPIKAGSPSNEGSCFWHQLWHFTTSSVLNRLYTPFTDNVLLFHLFSLNTKTLQKQTRHRISCFGLNEYSFLVMFKRKVLNGQNLISSHYQADLPSCRLFMLSVIGMSKDCYFRLRFTTTGRRTVLCCLLQYGHVLLLFIFGFGPSVLLPVFLGCSLTSDWRKSSLENTLGSIDTCIDQWPEKLLLLSWFWQTSNSRTGKLGKHHSAEWQAQGGCASIGQIQRHNWNN